MARGFSGLVDASVEQECCPCGTGQSYSSCCGRLHRGEAKAQTAEQLMRSRYSAFAKGQIEYLMATHPEPQVPASVRRRELRASCRQTRWLGLEIIRVERGRDDEVEGTVCFVARYQAFNQRGSLQETSLFQRRDGNPTGEWLYIRALD